MLNVSEAVKQAYINGNAKTEIFLTVTTTGGVVHEYDPRNILSGSVSIVESLCTSDNFDLSRVEKNQLTFTLFNITENISDLQGARVVARQRVYTDASDETVYTDIPLGVYTVDTAELDGQYLYKCTCFDSTMFAFDAIIDDWWNTTVTFPITIKNLAIALFRHLNVPYSLPETFTNYDYQLTSRNAYFQQIKASELLGYMQEVVAGYFKADRNGVIHLKSAVPVSSGLYPHIGLYPREGLYPRPSNRAFGEQDTAGVGDWNYPQIVGDLTIADYTAKNVTKLQIRSSDNDIGIIVGDGTNTYVIQGNPLLYNLTDETGRSIAQEILDAVKHVNYRPFTGKFMAMPFVEVGDVAKVTTLNGRTFDSPIFQRTLSGAHLAFDNFASPGFEYREQVKDTNRLLTTLNNTTHEVVNTVNELRSTVTETVALVDGMADTVETHTTQIAQNAESITLQAQRTGLFNLLTNSDFSNQANRFQSWSSGGVNAEYLYDERFKGSDQDYGQIENGYCAKISPTASGSSSFYQEINYSGTITEPLAGEITYRVLNADGATICQFLRFYSGSELILNVLVGSEFLNTGSMANTRWLLSDNYIQQLAGREITKIQYGIFILNGTVNTSVEVNHLMLTFSNQYLPFYSWTNYASKDVISQINIQPSGVTIQGEKIDIKGITTFSSGSSGTTVIDGGVVNVTNLNASNITTGTLSGDFISGGIIDGIEIDSGDMYWYKGTSNEASLRDMNVIYGSQSYKGVRLQSDAVYLRSQGGVIWLENENHFSLFLTGSEAVMTQANTERRVAIDGSQALVQYDGTHKMQVTSSEGLMRCGDTHFKCDGTYAHIKTPDYGSTTPVEHKVVWRSVSGVWVLALA